MFNLGPAEMIVIMGIALIVFGPKKLPEIGKGLGSALREFNKARNDFMESLHAEPDRDEPAPYAPPGPAIADTVPAETAGHYPGMNPADRKLEYPEPLEAASADALPYGSDFHAVGGDSQPSFRTAHPEPAPASTAATMTASAPSAAGERES
jgi:sec-independent protein translocase protein TatA